MRLYASMTTTKRNRAALKAHGWRWLITPDSRTRDTGGMPYAIDNGKWGAFNSGTPWNEQAFVALVAEMGAGADWMVVPDIVGGGLDSLALTIDWLPRLRALVPDGLLLIAVQDGMTPGDVRPLLTSGVGLFVGGTTDWKLQTLSQWADLAHDVGVYIHCGRVNSARRMHLCIAAGVDSVDGTSASIYAVTCPELTRAASQTDIEGYLRRAA